MTFAELLVTILITFGLVSLSAYIISIYTEMVRLTGQMRRSLARIDVMRCRLMDELPKLVKVCEADLGSDQLCIERLRATRQAFEVATSAEDRDEAEDRLSDALAQLFATVEAHPALQARPSFERLYYRVTDLENQIEESRSMHDETATVFNARIEGFVERRVAGWLSLGPIVPLAARCRAGQDDSAELTVPA